MMQDFDLKVEISLHHLRRDVLLGDELRQREQRSDQRGDRKQLIHQRWHLQRDIDQHEARENYVDAIARLQEGDPGAQHVAPGVFDLLRPPIVAFLHCAEQAIEPEIVKMGCDVAALFAVGRCDPLEIGPVKPARRAANDLPRLEIAGPMSSTSASGGTTAWSGTVRLDKKAEIYAQI